LSPARTSLVTNHKEDCEYRYSSAYQQNAAHFHGETAEQTWAELNHLGPQTRQMNNGHRQDVIIDHEGDWNWKKTLRMCKSLLLVARIILQELAANILGFLALTLSHEIRIAADLVKAKKRLLCATE